MKCPHCIKEIHFEEYGSWAFEYEDNARLKSDQITGYSVTYTICPACSELIVLLQHGKIQGTPERQWLTDISVEELLYPKGAFRPVEPEVPEKYRADYKEAAAVLSVSPKASAAISRRILQQLLRDECNVKKSSLAKEISEFTSREGIPNYLSEAVDAVRNVGNFAAHPLKDTNTGEIVEVETGEADWLLDVIDAFFDYIFVQPQKLKLRKEKLNEKLAAIGKPKMK